MSLHFVYMRWSFISWVLGVNFCNSKCLCFTFSFRSEFRIPRVLQTRIFFYIKYSKGYSTFWVSLLFSLLFFPLVVEWIAAYKFLLNFFVYCSILAWFSVCKHEYQLTTGNKVNWVSLIESSGLISLLFCFHTSLIFLWYFFNLIVLAIFTLFVLGLWVKVRNVND